MDENVRTATSLTIGWLEHMTNLRRAIRIEPPARSRDWLTLARPPSSSPSEGAAQKAFARPFPERHTASSKSLRLSNAPRPSVHRLVLHSSATRRGNPDCSIAANEEDR